MDPQQQQQRLQEELHSVDADLVTQLQAQVQRLLSLLYNFTGSLQRDAAPQSVHGEPLDVPVPPRRPSIPDMSEQLVQAFQPVQGLVDQLPDTRQPEAEQLAELVALQRQTDGLQQELAAAHAQAQAAIAQAQDVSAVVQHLKLRQQGAS